MAVNKIGAMVILLCGMILLGANVEVTAVRPGPEICPLYCIIGIEYVDCDGEKTYTDCTNCCFSNGCTLHFAAGREEYCTWPPEQKLGFGMILLGANVEVMAVRPCPRICILTEYKICNGTQTYTGCGNCCVDDGCTLYFEDGSSLYCQWPWAKY